MMNANNFVLTSLCAFLLISCSKSDSETEKTLTDPPEVAAATNVAGTSFTANWIAVEGATHYILEVSETTEFTSLVTGFPLEVTGESSEVSGLSDSKKYFYRLKAANGKGETGYSKVENVRAINKALLYDKIWIGDEEKSKTSFLLQDPLFAKNGTFKGYFAEIEMSSGSWTWKDSQTMTVNAAGSWDVKVIDVGSDYLVVYYSAPTVDLVYFN